MSRQEVLIERITPSYITGLTSSSEFGYSGLLYWPKVIEESDDKANDNSTVKHFREGSFNVFSTGDVENEAIGNRFLGKMLNNELDVLILPHHGSQNGCVKKNFLKRTKPLCAICSSNYDNEYDHPHESIRGLLNELHIPIFTTKTGDVIIESVAPHDGEFEVINLKSNSNELSSRKKFVSKKKKLLSMNKDTIRQRYKKKPYKGPS